ncbi:MAG: hypothetical protein KBS80_08395 [Bacteroidales bacterium]|nr:hypothetical protein [Candidatus Cryptobacteroides choladohippi]
MEKTLSGSTNGAISWREWWTGWREWRTGWRNGGTDGPAHRKSATRRRTHRVLSMVYCVPRA